MSRIIRTQRGQLRRTHAAWFRLAEKLNRIGQDIVLTPRKIESEHGDSDFRVVALLYFTCAFSGIQAAIVLAERGMIVEANTITREMIETSTITALDTKENAASLTSVKKSSAKSSQKFWAA